MNTDPRIDLDWLTLGPDADKAQALIDLACGDSVRAIERAIEVRKARDEIAGVEEVLSRYDVSLNSAWRTRYTDHCIEIARNHNMPAELRQRAAALLVKL